MKAPVTLKTERLVNAKQVVDGQALVMVSRRTPSAGAA
jgi:hypothetical protein